MIRAWAGVATVLAGCAYHGRDLGGDARHDDGPSAVADGPDGTDPPDAAPLGPFGDPAPINLLGADGTDDDPSLTGDELELYFNSSRGALSADIWVAKRAAITDPWGTPVPVSELSSAFSETTPEVSTDGLIMFFASDRPGGQGSADIFMSTRPDRDTAWTTPVIVPSLSSPASDASPGTTDGLAMAFTSDQDGGGDPDMFLATRPDTASSWSPWESEDAINSPGHDGSTLLLGDRRTLYFDTDREGLLRIYVAERTDTNVLFPSAAPVAGLESTTFNDQDPWVSPDQRHIVFWSDRGGAGALWEARR